MLSLSKRLFCLFLAWAFIAHAGPINIWGPRVPAAGGGGQTVSDDFNRADNASLGANWTTMTSESALKIASNTAQASSLLSDCGARYSGVAWSDNQSSEAKITESGGGSGAGPGVTVRCASGARTYYGVVINAAGQWELRKMSAGSFTSLATGTTTYSSGAVLKLSAIGTTITTTYNGVQIDSRTDATIASGSPGIFYSSASSAATIDDWVGRDGL